MSKRERFARAAEGHAIAKSPSPCCTAVLRLVKIGGKPATSLYRCDACQLTMTPADALQLRHELRDKDPTDPQAYCRKRMEGEADAVQGP